MTRTPISALLGHPWTLWLCRGTIDTLMRWLKDPSWTVMLEEGRAVLSAGADAMYLLDELDPPRAAALHRAWHAQPDVLEVPAPDEALASLLDQLAVMGVIARAQPPRSPTTVALAMVGPTPPRLAELLSEGLAARGHALVPDVARVAGADLTVLLRTEGTLLDAAKAAPAGRAHLFVDLAYQHTIVVGPLVWPGETACVGCLAGRVAIAWGDPLPPPAPAATGSPELVAALIVDKVAEFALHGTCLALVERSVSLDVRTLASRTERVHRLPQCPRCFPAREPWGTGSFPLPWAPGPRSA